MPKADVLLPTQSGCWDAFRIVLYADIAKGGFGTAVPSCFPFSKPCKVPMRGHYLGFLLSAGQPLAFPNMLSGFLDSAFASANKKAV